MNSVDATDLLFAAIVVDVVDRHYDLLLGVFAVAAGERSSRLIP
jgi:hypothetical protein